MKISTFLVCCAILLALGLATSACDEGHGFEFVNDTTQSVTLTYQIKQAGSDRILAHRTYSIQAGETVDTSQDTDESGEKGQHIFDRGRVLNLHAESPEGRILVSETLSYNQVTERDFRIVITEGGINRENWPG